MALTDKQIEEFYNPRLFKIWNYNLVVDPINIIIDSVAILIGDYAIVRKRAVLLILKVLVRDDFLKELLNDGVYPFERNDQRVIRWKNEILSAGKCLRCGSKQNLEAHHVLHWSEYPQGRADVNNGMCLCNTCHAAMHSGERCEKLILGRV